MGYTCCSRYLFFFFQAEDGIRDLVRSRGLGDVYKRQLQVRALSARLADRRITLEVTEAAKEWLALTGYDLSLIHI